MNVFLSIFFVFFIRNRELPERSASSDEGSGSPVFLFAFPVSLSRIYAFASRISTVTLSKTVSVMLLGWLFGGDLFDFVETADAFPLLPRLPRRDPVRDPGDRDFFAKVSRALARQPVDITRKAKVTVLEAL